MNGRDFVTGATSSRRTSCVPACSTAASCGPTATAATLVSVDDATARAMAGVDRRSRRRFPRRRRADRARARARAAAAIQAAWNVPAGQPSSETIFDYLKKNPERDGRARRDRHDRRCRAGVARTFEASLPDSLHRARAARAARRGRGVGGRQADGLDRHAASVRRARRAGARRFGCPRIASA